MKLTKTTAIIWLMVFMIGALVGLARAQQVGLKFPMYVQNPVTGEPVTGAWIYASAWESRPPVKVGGSATETSGGFYYFVLGDTASCDSCIPSDYYDLWVNNTLDSTRAGIPIGPGGLVLSCDMINSCHIIDDEVLLNEDMENDYGTDSTQTGVVYNINYDTKHDAATAAAPIKINVVDHGTGTTQSKVSGLDINQTVIGKDDLYNSPRGVMVSLVTDPDYPEETLDQSRYYGGAAFYGRLRVDKAGWGASMRVIRGSEATVFPTYNLPEVGGYWCQVRAESLGNWWSSSYNSSAGAGFFEVRGSCVHAIYGVESVCGADSSVRYVYAGNFRVSTASDLIYSWYPHNGYALNLYTVGRDVSCGVENRVHGTGANCRVTGYRGAMTQSVLGFGQPDYIRGVDLYAMGDSADWGDYDQDVNDAAGAFLRAGADTAYGCRAAAISDLDNANNKAIGVLGSAARAPLNIGVKGEAVKSVVGGTNIGIYGTAANGATNYAGYFDGPVYMSAGMQVEDLSVGTLTLDDVGSDAVVGLATVASGADTVRVTADDATSSSACAIFAFPVDRQPDYGDSLYVARITGGAFTIYAATQTANQGYFWVLIKR